MSLDVVVEPDPLNRNGPRDGRRMPVTIDVVGSTAVKRPVGYRRRRRTIPQQFLVHERRAKAYQLLAGDFTHLRIGLHLHADPSMCTNPNMRNPDGTQGGFPGGYGWQNYVNGKPPLRDEALRQAVSRDIAKGLELNAKYEAYSRDEWVARSLNTLGEAKQALWPKVLDGVVSAVEQVVAIEARKAKLLGLDQPDRVESSTVTTVVVGVPPAMDQEYVDKVLAALVECGAVKALEPAAPDPILDATGQEIAEAEVVHVEPAGPA